MRDIGSGNLGHSFFRAESVGDMISRRGPLTAEIAVLSVVLSWIVGVPVAIVSALQPNSIGDNVSRFLSILFLAVPGFWLGMLIVLGLLFVFGYRAPLAGASLFADPRPICRSSSARRSCWGSARRPISRAWPAPACSR
jgi:peptide/nickel transport system permease protein